ncbi:MAG: hypothetical protein KBI14_29070, partial [Kofleriaceae bacterium]|nr:hypothetical protein [Kofleriaceae bacterium]
AALTASSALLASGCADRAADSDLAPGLAPPSCAMTFTPYRIVDLDLPTARPFGGLDLDGDPDDRIDGGLDNQLGALHATIVGASESWNVNPAIERHLSEDLIWVLEVGRCTDGGDEVRVMLSRARDADADGALELVTRGVPAVGTRGPRITALHGIADVPTGYLTDGGGSFATDTWQRAFAVGVDLIDDGTFLTGTLGFAIGRLPDGALAPLAAYATTTLDEDSGIAELWRDEDVDGDGVISTAEVRPMVDILMRPDLDLGACDDDTCYRIFGDDDVRDRASVGVTIVAGPTVLE